MDIGLFGLAVGLVILTVIGNSKVKPITEEDEYANDEMVRVSFGGKSRK
jgi:hypothetical protein